MKIYFHYKNIDNTYSGSSTNHYILLMLLIFNNSDTKVSFIKDTTNKL